MVNCLITFSKTRGPRGPWVAHLRKKVKGNGGANYREPQGHNLNKFWWCYIPNMKALGLVISDKKIFESFISKTYLLTQWPTYATNWNGLNDFDRGPPRDHSCEVWSSSHKRFKRRCRLKFSLYNSMLNCDPRGGVNFNPRGIIWTTLVEDL